MTTPVKRLCTTVPVFLLSTAVPGFANAATDTGVGTINSFAARLANDVTAIAGSVALLFLAINGVRFIASNGHPAQQAHARAGLVSAAIGLAIVLSANLLVHLVVSALR
jgi:hypothetical protein